MLLIHQGPTNLHQADLLLVMDVNEDRFSGPGSLRLSLMKDLRCVEKVSRSQEDPWGGGAVEGGEAVGGGGAEMLAGRTLTAQTGWT